MEDWFTKIHSEQIQIMYGALAILGGTARYLNGILNGKAFKLSIFIASMFVSMFSAYMFILLGLSLNLPQNFVFMMSGLGAFFGDQTMHFLLEYTKSKINVE